MPTEAEKKRFIYIFIVERPKTRGKLRIRVLR